MKLKTFAKISSLTSIALASSFAHAVLPNGTTLNLQTGSVPASQGSSGYITAGTGSAFGMEVFPSTQILVALTNNDGVIVGSSQSASGSHNGAPNGTENPGIDQAWSFFGNTGLHQTTSNVSVVSDDGAGNVILNFSGWNVTWNGIASIPMGSGAHAGNTAGQAIMTCSGGASSNCEDGDGFALNYSATVPAGDPSGFGNVKYAVRLTGTLSFPAAPTADNDTASTIQNQAVTINILDGDVANSPGASIDASTVTLSDSDAGTAGNQSVQGGTIVDNGNGTVTYTPPAAYTGSDSFTYTVQDDNGPQTSNAATVTITVNSPGIPSANDVSASTTGTTAVNINLDAVDNTGLNQGIVWTTVTLSDSDGATAGNQSVNGGTVVDNADGTVTYTARSGFAGSDTFTYTVQDNDANTTNAATVTVAVAVAPSANSNTPVTSNGTLTAGSTAQSAGTDGSGLTAAQVGTDSDLNTDTDGQQCVGGCFDFVVTGFTGGSTSVILPLSVEIPAGASLRKLTAGGTWQDFSTDAASDGTFGTSALVAGSCPTDPTAYTSALTPGDQCIRVTIIDGGANDNNSTAGIIADPVGVGVQGTPPDTRTSGSGGGSTGLWSLVGLLGLWVARRRRINLFNINAEKASM